MSSEKRKSRAKEAMGRRSSRHRDDEDDDDLGTPRYRKREREEPEHEEAEHGEDEGSSIAARRSSRKVPMPKEVFDAAVELGNRQPTINMLGGVGIPGGRKLEDVEQFQPVSFKRLKRDLTGILSTAEELHAKKSEGTDDIVQTRKIVQGVNRLVEFDPGEEFGAHSLHVGNDIAAVWNSKRQAKSKVYDYPDLAVKLDARLETAERSGKTYWESEDDVATRRQHVATGMQHVITGKLAAAAASFEAAGLTARGRKWAYKMSTLMLAEKGREFYGGARGSPVHAALGQVGERSFTDVFASKATPRLAPFAVRGGAKTFKE